MEGAVMPKVVDAVRITTRPGAVWRACAGCGSPAPLPPAGDRGAGWPWRPRHVRRRPWGRVPVSLLLPAALDPARASRRRAAGDTVAPSLFDTAIEGG